MRTRLTPTFVRDAASAPGKERELFWDLALPGFGFMVTAQGARSYVVQYRAGRRSRRITIPVVLGLERARKQARALLGRVAMGQDPLAERREEEQAAQNTLRCVVEEYFRRDGTKLRTAKFKRATFERLILPKFGAKQIGEIKRSDIVRLLDQIEDQCGRHMADKVLAVLRSVFSWHARRSDEFNSPIVRGMARTSTEERARSRILNDDELRAVWRTAEQRGDAFGYLVRFILLTATRHNEAKKLTWDEIDGTDWLIPAARYKSKRDLLLPLSGKARTLLKELPRIGPGNWAFTLSGKRPLGTLTELKAAFDKACGVTGWRIHDLRRTARSLMSRAGVDADIAERCLGHTIAGVRGIYDRHAYRDEKLHAFEALAAQIERIVDPQPRVTPLRQTAAL
jgi:integrase